MFFLLMGCSGSEAEGGVLREVCEEAAACARDNCEKPDVDQWDACRARCGDLPEAEARACEVPCNDAYNEADVAFNNCAYDCVLEAVGESDSTAVSNAAVDGAFGDADSCAEEY